LKPPYLESSGEHHYEKGKLWEFVSSKTNISVSNLWRCHALEGLMDAIDNHEKGNYNHAWAYLMGATLFNGRVIGHKGGELIEFHTKIIDGAKKGGAALHKDNLPFKEAYRRERDSEQNKGKTRAYIINIVDMGFGALASSMLTWAKQADLEDGFIRKGGRPPKKMGS